MFFMRLLAHTSGSSYFGGSYKRILSLTPAWAKVVKTLPQNRNRSQVWWYTPIIPAIKEDHSSRSDWAKKLVRPISTSKSGMVVSIYNPTYVGAMIGGLRSKVGPGQNVRPYSKNN
jgi:hypothetical protein